MIRVAPGALSSNKVGYVARVFSSVHRNSMQLKLNISPSNPKAQIFVLASFHLQILDSEKPKFQPFTHSEFRERKDRKSMSSVVELDSSSQDGHEESNGEQFDSVDLTAKNLSLPSETLLRAAVTLKDQVSCSGAQVKFVHSIRAR